MNLSHYTFSLPPRKVPLSRFIVILSGNLFAQFFVWLWIGCSTIAFWHIDWNNTLVNPSDINAFGVKREYTKAVLTDTYPVFSNKYERLKNKNQTYAYQYRFHLKNEQFEGISFQEADQNLLQVGDTLTVCYVADHPTDSSLEGMRNRTGSTGAFFVIVFINLIGILGLIFFIKWNLATNYLIRYGHLAIGKFEEQLETKGADGDTFYQIKYTFQALNNQFYPAEETLSLPSYGQDEVILYKAEEPKKYIILKVDTLYETFDQNFQLLPAAWDDIFQYTFMPICVICGHLLSYFDIFH